MSVVVRFNPVAMTAAKYDEAVRRHEDAGIELPPDGMSYHVCFGSEGNLRVSEIWDSREQLAAYGERLMPILADVGIEFSGEPEILEVHTSWSADRAASATIEHQPEPAEEGTWQLGRISPRTNGRTSSRA